MDSIESTGQQLTLEDARDRREVGMQAATHSTDVAWILAADRTIAELAATFEPFTADEVKAICGPPTGSPNAMGARFSAAAKAGVIRRVGYRQSTQASRQGGVVAVWVGAP